MKIPKKLNKIVGKIVNGVTNGVSQTSVKGKDAFFPPEDGIVRVNVAAGAVTDKKRVILHTSEN